MSNWLLFILLIFYLGILFFIASYAEKRKRLPFLRNSHVYALSLAVYSTAWTYYGSVGIAATSGIAYLTIYIGPIIIIPAWIFIVSKIIRISRVNKISSIADFISLRYGNGRALGALVALICFLAIIPYIGLQIKAISDTFHLVSKSPLSDNILVDSATYVVLIIALFSSYYGTRYVDASEKRLGIISAVAVESILKIVFFAGLGLYVIFHVFNGFSDLLSKAVLLPDFEQLNSIHGLEGGVEWMLMSTLSMFAIFLLPRQFHTTIVENIKEQHLKTAMWMFPLYLLIINLFVFPIAWGGKILFLGESINFELLPILIPQKYGHTMISTFVFFGGLSASVSMIIISSISLSIMLSNNLIIPYGWLDRFSKSTDRDNSRAIVGIRKFSIFSLIIAGFLFYKYLIRDISLFSVGLVSFVLVAQLAPSFFGAIFWRRGTLKGALAGLLAGILYCSISLITPMYFPNSPIASLTDFLTIPFLSPISNAFFWSMVINGGLYGIISVSTVGTYRERNFAELYVDINTYIKNHENAYIWRGKANISDIQKILIRFLGENKTKQALNIFNQKYRNSDTNDTADARFIKFSENLLSGRIGTASAKILIEGVTKEDYISLPEVLQILEESKENIAHNRKLAEQSEQLRLLSQELKSANENLLIKDKQKDDFLDSVAHELRTPITAIRATSELLQEDEEMPYEIKHEFLSNIISESDRLATIINDILFLDKLESGTLPLNIEEKDITESYQKAFKPLQNLFEAKQLHHSTVVLTSNNFLQFDENKIIQVFQNILGNAVRFSPDHGSILTKFQEKEDKICISIFNTGKKIPQEDLEYIFDKFYQSKNQNLQKPTGSGLGLAISKKIIETHEGKIHAKNAETGVTISIELPLERKNTIE